jgi:hypothetical protein
MDAKTKGFSATLRTESLFQPLADSVHDKRMRDTDRVERSATQTPGGRMLWESGSRLAEGQKRFPKWLELERGCLDQSGATQERGGSIWVAFAGI